MNKYPRYVRKEVEAMLDKEKIKSIEYKPVVNGVKVDFELQYRDMETDMQSIAHRVAEDYARRGNDPDKIEKLNIYLKPTDFTAYYVINDIYEGKVPLF